MRSQLAEVRTKTQEQIAALPEQRLNELSALAGELEELEEAITREETRVDAVRRITEARREFLPDLSADGSRISVESESMVYGCNEHYESEHSWWLDQCTLAAGWQNPQYPEAVARLQQYGQQVEREVANRSKFGRRAESELREKFRRNPDAHRLMDEVRSRGRAGALALEQEIRVSGVATGGGPTVTATSGASSFITPTFEGPPVLYREYGRAFADQCAKPAMPATGMGIYKPVVTSGAAVAQFTELGTVTELDPAVGYLVGALAIYAGQISLSQAVIDRSDFRYDLIAQEQIAIDEAPKLDAYVIGKAISNGAAAVGYNSTFAVASTSGVSNSLYGHVSQAKAVMRKTVGAVLNPTHVWFDPARWEVVAGWGDANGRPVAVPDYAGPFNALAAGSADGDAGCEGATGYRFNGLRAFTDANLPTTGGTAELDQVLVTCQNQIEYYEGPAVNRILPQTLATSLATIVDRYRYVAVIENYSAATQPIQGTAFTAPSWGS